MSLPPPGKGEPLLSIPFVRQSQVAIRKLSCRFEWAPRAEFTTLARHRWALRAQTGAGLAGASPLRATALHLIRHRALRSRRRIRIDRNPAQQVERRVQRLVVLL